MTNTSEGSKLTCLECECAKLQSYQTESIRAPQFHASMRPPSSSCFYKYSSPECHLAVFLLVDEAIMVRVIPIEALGMAKMSSSVEGGELMRPRLNQTWLSTPFVTIWGGGKVT